MATTQKAASKGPKAPRVLPAGTLPPAVKKMAEVPEVEITEEQREGERRQAQNNATAQFVNSQLQTAAAHPPALADKTAEFQAAVAKLAAEMGVTAPALTATKPARTKVEANGITRPAAGTETGKVWDAADQISVSQNGHPAAIAQVKAHTLTRGMNEHTIKTQYARWRQFHGIKGRQVIVKSEPVEGHYEGLPILA